MVQSPIPNPDAGKADLFSFLWNASDENPYDEDRERAVTQRRFGRVIPYVSEQLQRIRRTSTRKLRVLDFGCSDGHTAGVILADFASETEYYGNDLYEPRGTRDRMRSLGFVAEVSGGSLEGIPAEWPEFDVAFAFSCFQYITSPDAAFSQLASRVAMDGLIVAYFYDAGPLRQCTDGFLRERFGGEVTAASSAVELSRTMESLTDLVVALRDATDGVSIHIRSAVPKLGIPVGSMPLQQFIIDHLLFAWAPPGASRERINWALTEMFMTGSQIYVGLDDIDRIFGANGIEPLEITPGPSGHLVIGRRMR